MTDAKKLRLVPVEPDPFDETMALIEEHRWEPTEDFAEDAPEWQAGESKVRWVVDGETGVQFFVVEGGDAEAVAGQIEAAIDVLHVADFEAYLERFHGTQGLMRGLYSVAAAAPAEPDPKVIELFERYLRHDDPLIRRTTLVAIGITGWTEFAEPVRALLDDPDADVRGGAEAALRALPS